MQTVNPIFIKPPKAIKQRQTRSDKTIDIKFPVTDDEWLQLRRAAINKGLGDRQTKYNTLLLNAALDDLDFDPIEYKDTGRYMHVKPTQLKHERIVDLMLHWGLSKRKTVHRIMINAIGRL